VSLASRQCWVPCSTLAWACPDGLAKHAHASVEHGTLGRPERHPMRKFYHAGRSLNTAVCDR